MSEEDGDLPTVSVIVPNARGGDVAMTALRGQTHRPAEIITSDDLRSAVARSAGEILFFVAPGIAPAPDAIATAVRLLRERPDYGCVRGIPGPNPRTYRAVHDHHRLSRVAGPVCTVSFDLAAMPRAVHDEIGPLDTGPCPDIEYGTRLAPRHPILLTEQITGDDHRRTRLRDVFGWSQLLVPAAAVYRKANRTRTNSPVAVLAAAIAVLAAPLAALSLPFLLLPLACLLLFALADRVPPRFAPTHFVVCLTVAAGATFGLLRWLVDERFGPARPPDVDPVPPLVPPTRPKRRRQAMFTAVFAVAIVLALYLAFRDQDWRLAGRLVRPAALPAMLLACLANLAGLVIAMVAWRRLLVDTAGRVGHAVAGRIYFVGVLTQKLPGRVWGLLTHIRLGRTAGFTPTRMVIVYALNLPVVLMTAAAVGSTVAPSVLGGRAFLLVVPLLLTVGMYARPQAISLFVGRLLLLVGRVLPGGVAPTRAMRFSIVTSIVSWLVSGLHLWVLAILLGAHPWPALPACVGGFALAMLVSSLAVFLPDGWGAREVTMVIPLATVLPLPVAGIAAVASRLVTFASELAGAALAVLLARLVEHRTARPVVAVDTTGVGTPGRQDSHV